MTYTLYELTHPLRSILITRTSSLLQDDPPPSWVSILSPFVVLTYRVFSSHPMKSSHVPQKSPNQARANCTPGATQAVNGYPLSLSWSRAVTPILAPSELAFDASIGSLIAHLLDSYLTYLVRLFLNAHHRAFSHSSLRRFEICTCMPISEGLPPSLLQPRDAKVPTFRTRAWIKVTPLLCRTPLGQLAGSPTSLSWGTDSPQF